MDSTVNLEGLAATIWAWLNDRGIVPLVEFFRGLEQGDRLVLYVLLAIAVSGGFLIGRTQTNAKRRLRRIQNKGEALVSGVLSSSFAAPDYHLMNHVTIRMNDGTTQIDHILVSRFGVFVIETKHYTGWLFADAARQTWTQVLFSEKYSFQNPIFQNMRHVRAVRDVLDFLPPDAIKSVVAFSGDAEFQTPIPAGVVTIGELAEYLRQHTEEVMSLNRLQFCVGRLETARLAITAETDIEHMRSLERRHGTSAV